MRSSSTAAPGLGALAAHALDREQHLLAVGAHAEDDQQRDGGRFAVEPHPHHRAVEDEPHDRLFGQRAGIPGVPVALHLAPDPAHRVLADRAAEQGGERAAHPARVGAGKIACRRSARRRRACGADKPAAPGSSTPSSCRRGCSAGRAAPRSRSARRSRSASASGCRAVARNAGSSFIAGLRASPVARASQHRVELAADQLFDELASPIAHLGLDRIKPVVEKLSSWLGRRLRRIRLRGSARHGVVSSRRFNAGDSRLITPETTPPSIPTNSGRHQLVGTGTVVVTGHSLGSALATYFADDLAERLGSGVSACLFASPRTGDSAWASLFAANVKEYRLFNYILDIVTHVPTLGYATLPKATIIQPSTAQAGIRLDVFCDHHVICYCAMIDYKKTMVAPTTAQDASCKSCILPPPSVMPKSAKALATIINEFGVGDERTLVMLKALHTVNTA